MSWTGIIAALLVNLNLWFVPLAGFFFAAIYTGAAGMGRIAQVPKVATVIQAVIILFVVGKLGNLTNYPLVKVIKMTEIFDPEFFINSKVNYPNIASCIRGINLS